MLKTGIISSAYFSFDNYKEGLKAMHADGYDCCDYHGFINYSSPLYTIPKQQMESYLTNLRDCANNNSIEFFQLHAVWPLACANKDEIDSSIALVKKSVIGASIIDCKRVVVHPLLPFGINDDADPDLTINLNKNVFKDLALFAQDYDVIICIENLPYLNLPLSRVDAIINLIDLINLDNCKMCLDTGHAHIFHENIFDTVIRIGSRLSALHVHDNRGDADSHLMPWMGTIDWFSFSSALKQIGFNGCISLETKIGKHVPQTIRRKLSTILFQIAKQIANIT